jgi:5-methylthioadenosine/S-adenosylhomocysteine deaminase
MNPAREIIPGGFLAVEGDRITYVGKGEPEGGLASYDAVIDARGMIVLPGLINMHQHHWYNLLKGLGDGLTLDEWFTELALPAFAHIEDADLRVSMYLACLEMIQTGTTCWA